MRALIKFGGSLQQFPHALKKLCQHITFASDEHDLYILPGGGGFTDKVRELDYQYRLDQTTTHWMAIAAMEAYAYLLHSLTPESLISHEILEEPPNKPKIILPYIHLRAADIFPHSWDVSSDSIALYYAHRLNSALILLKVVDGINDAHGTLINKLAVNELKTMETNIVDVSFAETLQKYKVKDCWIINGLTPNRLLALLQHKQVLGTKLIL
ncbi:MAG: hypothetical protein ACE5R6_09640 [Candidatus Heimdallarchaeota archaeon]